MFNPEDVLSSDELKWSDEWFQRDNWNPRSLSHALRIYEHTIEEYANGFNRAGEEFSNDLAYIDSVKRFMMAAPEDIARKLRPEIDRLDAAYFEVTRPTLRPYALAEDFRDEPWAHRVPKIIGDEVFIQVLKNNGYI